jgi:hypothetical protein
MAQKKQVDSEVLAEVIVAKQEELKKRLLSDIVVRNVRTTNYATYNTLYYLVSDLVDEKNKTVMTQSIINEIGRYVIAHIGARYVIETALDGKLPEGFSELELPEVALANEDWTLFKGLSQKQNYTEALVLEQTSDALKEKLAAQFYSYAIDSLFKGLYKSPILSEIGLVDATLKDRFITSGLKNDFEEIRDELKKNYGEQYKLINEKINYLLNLSVDKVPDIVAGAESDRAWSKLLKEALDVLAADNFSKFPKPGGKELAFNVSKASLAFIIRHFEAPMQVYKEVGQGAIVAKLADIITKYVIFDVDEKNEIYPYKIDVEGIILALENDFLSFSVVDIRKHWVGVKPFFNIGFTYGAFFDKDNALVTSTTGDTPLYQIALAGERIGLKILFADLKYSRSQKPNEWYRYKGTYWWWNRAPKKPIFNNFYGFVYASGIIYNIVDVKSEKTFNYPIVGGGLGVAFFNDLELNISLAVPIQIEKDSQIDLNNSFISLGFDIPIFEYLKAVRNK